MSIYYIYAYLRLDGTPYYIGKGKGIRAYQKQNHKVSVPKNKSQIIIMETNLTEVGALALERFYIRWYGRKNIGTGILRNLTDGGEGVSGLVLSEESRNKISLGNKGKKQTSKAKEKISKSKKGKGIGINAGAKHPFYGKTHTLETRERLSRARKGRKYSPETCLKMSEAKKDTCWINNGIETKRIKRKDIDFWIEMNYNIGRTRNRGQR